MVDKERRTATKFGALLDLSNVGYTKRQMTWVTGLSLNEVNQFFKDKTVLFFLFSGFFNNGIDPQFYDGHAELGYAYADLGQMDDAQRIVDKLEPVAPELADTLSRYMYKVDSPKIMFAQSAGTFSFLMAPKTAVPMRVSTETGCTRGSI